MGTKKKNPIKIQKTQKDVDRAWQDGADFGVEFCINNFLLVLKDKMNMPYEDILRLRSAFMEQIDSINKRYCTYSDVRKALGGDYNLFVEMEDIKGERT